MAAPSAPNPAPPPFLDGKPPPGSVSEMFAKAAKDSNGFASLWDKLWKGRHTPWDRGGPSMALHDVLAERPDLFPSPSHGRRLKALVPGAGRGHDVLLLASFGYDAYGLDISPDAAEEAKRNEAENRGLDVYRREGVERGTVSWLTGDYFAFDFTEIGPFDLIFDYTFLCAMPLELRPKWSKAMANNLAPNGRLVCLEYPSAKPVASPGPPFGLRPIIYEALLGRPGKEVKYDGNRAIVVEQLGPESPDRLERLAHLVPKRSHDDGYDEDGNVVDRISVWAHPS